MKRIINKELSGLQIVNGLVCTELGKEILEQSTDEITGRERQFLRLLINDDQISKRACARVANKVPLIQMYESGWIDVLDNGLTLFLEIPEVVNIVRPIEHDDVDVLNDANTVSAEELTQYDAMPEHGVATELDTHDDDSASIEQANLEQTDTLPIPNPVLQIAAGVFI